MNTVRIWDIILYNPDEPVFFSTGFFLWFFTFFIVCYSIFQKRRIARLFILIIFSFYFYYKSSGKFVILLAFVSFISYSMAFFVSTDKIYLKKFAFFSVLISNLGLLVAFKYSFFFLNIFGFFSGAVFTPFDLIIPIGISFFVFQNLGYFLDVYKGNLKTERNLINFLAFSSFFPVIQAGPILRASNFLKQIISSPDVTNENLSRAVFFVISGLLKKGVISDYIGINFIDRVFDNPLLYSGFENLFAIFGYALQIYCDFSGYSDIAVGLALFIGISLPPNFNLPYKSSSIKEFWQRWHISLSFWFRDFLFLPIAYSIARKLNNKNFLGIKAENWSYVTGMIITMLLCGLWHGPSWSFILWGALYGVGISLERVIKSLLKFRQNSFSKSIGAVITFLFVCFCWVFFRSANFDKAFEMFSQVFSAFNLYIIPQVLAGYKEVFIIILSGYAFHFLPERFNAYFERLILKSPLMVKAVYVILAVYIVIQFKSVQILPFIYFNF